MSNLLPDNTVVAGNAPTFADLLKDAEDLGKQRALGNDTQIKFDLKIAEAAFHGRISLDKDKHGTGIDDAAKLSEVYAKAQGSATIFDAKAPNQRKLISTTRTMIKFGSWTKGGTGEPLNSLNAFVALRQKLRADPANAKKLDDAHNSALRYARAQIREDNLIPQSRFREFIFKSQPDLRTVEEILAGIRKTAQDLLDGKAAKNTAQDTSAEVLMIKNAVTKRLADIAVARGANGSVPVPTAPKSV